ncbi:MAG: hypothetical protein RL391_886 [Actinomycetota bacterium]|jgi:DNA-binding MarR family transcriptional regulator
MAGPEDRWTFLSNHAHVLVCLAEDPNALVREVALRVGITERRVNGIIGELEAAGIIRIRKVGRRNSYSVNRRARLRHPLESHKTVDDLLNAVS